MLPKRSLITVTTIGMFVGLSAAGCGTSHPHHHSNPKSKSQTTSPSGVTVPTVAHLSAGKLLILAPADLKAKSTVRSSARPGTYNVTVLTDSGAQISFGGQHYASSSRAHQTLINGVMVSPGPGIRDPLGSGVSAHKYPQQHLITWTHDHWIIEVSGTSGTPFSVLQKPARTIATLLKEVSLPATSQGLLHWTVTLKSPASIDLAWTKGSAIYHVIQPQAKNSKTAMQMAASMVPIP